jgi:putative DNA primase/helicase
VSDEETDLLPAPADPMAVARRILPFWTSAGHRTLRNWRGVWMRWEQTHWAEVDDKEIRSAVYQRVERATYIHMTAKGPETRKWAPTKRKVADLMEATAMIVLLPATVDAPAWLTAAPGTPQGPMVACANGLLHVGTRELHPLDPQFFNLVSVPFACDQAAPEPKRWLKFLESAWPDDAASIEVLQEFFGYVLSGRTDLHKILLIIGPTRSGKGTIARTLTQLIGKANVAGPTLASLTTNFGLAPLLGKPLALVSDARLGGRENHQVVERLLTISGEDTIDVDRKYREPWTGRLPTRFLILSNELPNFGDASGTIAHRFLVLTMDRSWLGQENFDLERELAEELPGILNWALEGLVRLVGRGRFAEPKSSIEAVTAMEDLASPMSAFVRERCDKGPARQVPVDELFTAWRSWCEENGRDKPGTKQVFGRNLQATQPQVRMARPRDGDTRQRVYTGLALRPLGARLDENHNGVDRGPLRTTEHSGDATDRMVRDGPRSDPLWSQHSCADCREPFDSIGHQINCEGLDVP